MYYIQRVGTINHEPQKRPEKYRLIVEVANDVIYETNAKGEFTLVNPKTLDITGYQESELLGESYLSLIAPEARNEVQLFYCKQLQKGDESTYKEVPIQTKKGKIIWVGLNVQLLKNDLEVQGFIGVGRDITESYHNRLELKYSEEKY